MPLPASKVDRALISKIGFERQDRRHRVYLLRIDDRIVAQTLMSHSAGDLDNKILSMIARQMGIRLAELEGVVSCTLSRDDYLALLGVK